MSYIRDRLIQAAVTLYLIQTITFFMTVLMPGGPVEALRQDMMENPRSYGLSRPPSMEEINAAIEQRINVDPGRTPVEQYVDFMANIIIDQNLGTSIVVEPGVPVWELIVNAAPWTIFLSLVGLIYGFVVGIILGTIMAYYEGTKFDSSLTVLMVVDSAVPYYVVAIFLLFFAAFQLGWFPTGGRYNPDLTPGLNPAWVRSVFYYATLPILSFVLTGFGGSALGMRANAIRLLGSDPVRHAELRGLTTYKIAVGYLGRNAILPIWTSVVISLGGLIGGSVILEFIFQYPGMGLLMFEAATLIDYPLLMGTFFLTATLFIIGTLLADFTYPLIDPRADVKEDQT